LVLEEALYVLQNSDQLTTGSQLQAEIEEGLMALRVPRILDQLRGPLAQDVLPVRKKAVQMLRGMLDESASGVMDVAITADYMQLVVASLTSSELVEMADWSEVLRRERTMPW
jgi:hypothetical protein